MSRHEIEERQITEYRVGRQTFLSLADAERHVQELEARPMWADWAAEHFPSLMPLMRGEDAAKELGWTEQDGKHVCCGQPVRAQSFFGHIVRAACEKCGKEVADLTGPQLSESGASLGFLDTELFQIFEGDPIYVIVSRGTQQEAV